MRHTPLSPVAPWAVVQPSSDRAALLAAIRADPANDLPRLVFADWLDDAGDAARAEFIRIQCCLTAAADPPQMNRLRRREAQLLNRHLTAWTRRLDMLGVSGGSFVRGFLSPCRVRVEGLLGGWRRLAELEPASDLRLVGVRDELGAILLLPIVTAAASLGLAGELQHPVSRSALAAGADRFDHLTAIDLSANNLGGVCTQRLAASGLFRRARELRLSHNQIDDLGLQAVARSIPPGQVRRADFAVNCISDAGVEALVQSGCLSNAEHVDLYDNPIGDRGAMALARADWSRLTWLSVRHEGLSPGVKTALGQAVPVAGLSAAVGGHVGRVIASAAAVAGDGRGGAAI